MKKMLLVLLAAGLSLSAAQAQTATTLPAAKAQGHRGQHKDRAPRTAEQRADMHMQRLTKQLGLSADQQPKVRAIFLSQTTDLEALRAKKQTTTADNRAALGQEIKSIQARTDEQLKGVLSAEQYAKYDQARADRMENRAGKKQQFKDSKTKMKVKA